MTKVMIRKIKIRRVSAFVLFASIDTPPESFHAVIIDLPEGGKSRALQAGFYQNILFSSSLTEQGRSTVVISPDEGALKYNFGALAGIEFNFGRFVFLELKYHYGLSKSYVIYGKGFPSSFATVGLGFNLISTRKSAF